MDDEMMPNMMGAPVNPSNEKRWIIWTIVMSILFIAAVVVAVTMVSNARTDIRDCEQQIADGELDVTAAEADLLACQQELEEAGVQKVGDIDATSQEIGFQYPFGTHVARHIRPASATQPMIEYRLDDNILESCDECSPGGQTKLVVHTYEIAALELEDGEDYSTRIIDNYNSDEYQDVNVEKQNEKNGTLTLVSGEQIGGYATPEDPISFETYIFEGDRYVVVAWLDVSEGADDGIVNFFHETLDTSEIQ